MQDTSPHKPIASKDNSSVKYVRSLSEHKYRRKEKAFLIEGIKMVEEALRENLGVTMVVATPSLLQHHGKGVVKLAESKSVNMLWISDTVMGSLSESKTPQPAMAVVGMIRHSEEILLGKGTGLIVIAHQLQDPGNLGTIVRTAEAVGASGVAVTANTVDPYNAKAVRASMGSVLRLPVVQIADLNAFVKKCRQRGFQTLATVLTAEKTHFDIDLTKPTALIFGQEGSGLPHELLSEVDLPVRIPMAETIDSLNVATSAAVILYEAMRQRMRNIS